MSETGILVPMQLKAVNIIMKKVFRILKVAIV